MNAERQKISELTHIEDRGTVFAPSVMIVGDEDFVKSLVDRRIGERGYDVICAPSLSEAIKQLSRRYFLVIFCPASMRDADRPAAIAILEFLKQNYNSTKLVIMADSRDFDSAVSLLKAGAYEILSKPIDLHRFDLLVGELFNDQKDNFETIMKYPPAGYKVLKEIGKGALCKVILVENIETRSLHALKVFQKNACRVEHVKRFFREANILAGIDHPNVVKIHEYGLSDQGDVPFIIMEYLRGKTLREIIDSEPVDQARAFKILRQITDAIRVVHGHGVLHRDLKPTNILVTPEGDAKIIDFGVARVLDSDLTMTKSQFGAPPYMAPEAFDSARNVDERSEIFSIGVIAYEMFTKCKPFSGTAIANVISSIKYSNPIDPLKHNGNIPAEIREAISFMIRKNPSERYKNAGELLATLDQIAGGRYKLREQEGIASKLLGHKSFWT